MHWIYIAAGVTALISIYLGYKRFLFLDQVTKRNLSFSLLGILLLFLLMEVLQRMGYFPQEIGAAVMSSIYASLFGFFTGAAIQQFNQKKEGGDILYINRSFWTDIFPNIISIALILFGIQRTSILGDLPVTPIRLTSGLSILAVGCWGFTIRLVPEFRRNGMILLDKKIKWAKLITYSWFSEHVVEIEYSENEAIKSFKTMIPEEDHLLIEKILSEKMTEKIEKDSFDEYEEVD